MSVSPMQQEVMDRLKAYLAGGVSDEDVSDWALSFIDSADLGSLPPAVVRAVHALFDLHDSGESWAPSRSELEQHLAALQAEEIAE